MGEHPFEPVGSLNAVGRVEGHFQGAGILGEIEPIAAGIGRDGVGVRQRVEDRWQGVLCEVLCRQQLAASSAARVDRQGRTGSRLVPIRNPGWGTSLLRPDASYAEEIVSRLPAPGH
ncbi:hypothetical protein LRS73_34090 (plasmid) [Methylobacterium currus]|uniref:hypothetical protein n=1 Tax=Methylobacterium currus TaxID=2051553 RepID=UPI001E46C04A|nr:hypothetical protein [Methylobacterium currus]UHC20004.1 hypothetical protein LRS73_34090 [Methylobacterium currus]